MGNKELERLDKEIKLKNKIYLEPLINKRNKLREEEDKKEAEKLIGKTFVYKNNSYSCPEKDSDYWDVYLKVIGIGESGLIVLTVEKTSYNYIIIRTETRWNNNLSGYIPCDKRLFDNQYEKLTKELNNLK